MLDCMYCGRQLDQTEFSFKSKFMSGEVDEVTGEPEDCSLLCADVTCECGQANFCTLSQEEANA